MWMTVFLSFILDEDVQSRFENWRTGRVGLQEIYSTRNGFCILVFIQPPIQASHDQSPPFEFPESE